MFEVIVSLLWVPGGLLDMRMSVLFEAVFRPLS